MSAFRDTECSEKIFVQCSKSEQRIQGASTVVTDKIATQVYHAPPHFPLLEISFENAVIELYCMWVPKNCLKG